MNVHAFYHHISLITFEAEAQSVIPESTLLLTELFKWSLPVIFGIELAFSVLLDYIVWYIVKQIG